MFIIVFIIFPIMTFIVAATTIAILLRIATTCATNCGRYGVCRGSVSRVRKRWPCQVVIMMRILIVAVVHVAIAVGAVTVVVLAAVVMMIIVVVVQVVVSVATVIIMKAVVVVVSQEWP